MAVVLNFAIDTISAYFVPSVPSELGYQSTLIHTHTHTHTHIYIYIYHMD